MIINMIGKNAELRHVYSGGNTAFDNILLLILLFLPIGLDIWAYSKMTRTMNPYFKNQAIRLMFSSTVVMVFLFIAATFQNAPIQLLLSVLGFFLAWRKRQYDFTPQMTGERYGEFLEAKNWATAVTMFYCVVFFLGTNMFGQGGMIW